MHEVTKRPIFCFVDPNIRPDHTLEAFAFDDDYSFGILQSNAHWQWFVAKCSKLESDFVTLPNRSSIHFPGRSRRRWSKSISSPKRDAKCGVCAARRWRKSKAGCGPCIARWNCPGKNPLKDAHVALDAAVLGAYGFSAKGDLLAQLLDLNLQVARRLDAGEAVTAPGLPPDYPDPSGLITDDCIRPK